MIFLDIIYPPLIDLLQSVCDAIENSLDNEETDHGNEQFEVIGDIKDKIQSAYGENAIPCLRGIVNALDDGGALYELSSESWIAFKALLGIAVTIEGDGGISLSDEVGIDPDFFKISEYQGNDLPFQAFGYFNGDEGSRSLAYLKVDTCDMSAEISDSGFSLDLLAAFYYHLSELPMLAEGKDYILYREDAVNQKAAESALKLLATFSGRVVHRESRSNFRNIPHSISNGVCATKSYHQFEETLMVLSEVNQAEGVINRFLNVYHVIESFMYKVPLVALGKSSNNNLFSIRDFRRLYEWTSGNESSAIANLFNDRGSSKFWRRDIDGQRFDGIVRENAESLSDVLSFDLTDCNSFLSCLGCKVSDHNDLINGMNANVYADLVYKIRCSIVHNKETEHHISHFNLNESTSAFIDMLLIGPLLILIADLLSDDTSQVWYTGPALNLYEASA